MDTIKIWVSERSGKQYTIFKNAHGDLACTCPACYYGQQCWEMKKLVGDREANEVRVALQRRPKVRAGWWAEYPELKLEPSPMYVFEAWRSQNQINMRRKW